MERKVYIDYLKIIGLLLVILAHVSPPVLVNQLRSFDVPLLVLVSGYLAAASYKGGNVKRYLYKRVKRLAFPAWIFICIFLPVRIVAYNQPTIEEVLKEVFFQRDSDMLGFLWVIWVYLVCACLIPIISKLKFGAKSISLWLLVLVVFEACCRTQMVNSRLLYMTLFTIVPFGFITFIGYNITKITRPYLWVLVSFVIYALYSMWLYSSRGNYVQTDIYKYPVQIYYLSFALSLSILIFVIFSKLKVPRNRLIEFMSSSSLWIYLWHIIALYAVKMFIENDEYWLSQYVLIVFIATIITYIQNIIVDELIINNKNQWLKVFKG